MKGAPRSKQFDDIYFSAKDGLAETQHVFLQGNNLPHAWTDKKQFTIGETGFGTGLNFLAVWVLFEKTAQPGQTLDFVSFERFPLTPAEIREYLTPWHNELGDKVDLFLSQYPLRIAGFHRLKLTPQITLTLIFDDINDAIPTLDAAIDCWFLDGFTPAKNPEMWTNTVFENMARLSHTGASYATFTAAKFGRQKLSDTGFSVEKTDGFGTKRDMIFGVYKGKGVEPSKKNSRKSRIALIGGGLAGTACAYTLKQYGFDPVIYEASSSLATGASGNALGFYNPRFSALRDPLSSFYVPAFNQLYQTAKQTKDSAAFMPCGALHLINTSDKESRFSKMLNNWQWHNDHIQRVSAKKASEISNIQIDHDALYLPDSGAISPAQLCQFYAHDIQTHLNTSINDIIDLSEDIVILCNGSAAQDLIGQNWINLEVIRGQTTEIATSDALSKLKCNIHHSGYLSQKYDGKHMLGATFDRHLDDTAVTNEDHDENIHKMRQAIPALQKEDISIMSGRASLRASTNDRFPVVGSVPDNQNTYISTAFGSYGIVGSIMAAHYLADILRGNPVNCLPKDTQYALSPQRFIDRIEKAKKNT